MIKTTTTLELTATGSSLGHYPNSMLAVSRRSLSALESWVNPLFDVRRRYRTARGMKLDGNILAYLWN
jgi:hypothetical protein